MLGGYWIYEKPLVFYKIKMIPFPHKNGAWIWFWILFFPKKKVMVLNVIVKIRPNFEWHWWLIVGYPFLTLDYNLLKKTTKIMVSISSPILYKNGSETWFHFKFWFDFGSYFNCKINLKYQTQFQFNFRV